jgi:hypothetical protein
MLYQEFVQPVMSFLGGGFVAAFFSWAHSYFSIKRQREIDSIKEQLKNLYGPLNYFCHQNENLFKLCKQIDVAYKSEYVDKKWSADERTRQSVRDEAKTTIEISNKYIQEIIKNNQSITEILEKGWHLADVEDLEVFADFEVFFKRYKIEGNTMPYDIYEALGSISLMPSNFIKLVKEKASLKELRLRKLLK